MFAPPARRREQSAQSDALLPNGDCQYILLHPEIKGLRCACVGFALNRNIPGSTCNCGHQACYHLPTKGATSGERTELDALQERIKVLEQQLGSVALGEESVLMHRIKQVEEHVDKTQTNSGAEMKNIYLGISGLWQNIGILKSRTPYYDDRIEGLVDEMQRMRNRLIEVDDASMRLEDRVDVLENVTTPLEPKRTTSTPDRISPSPSEKDRESRASTPLHAVTPNESLEIQTFRERVASVGAGAESWTVHISLLPSSSQPFPFEKDTAAYKRCLSRGLHRVLVIPNTDSRSFRNTIDTAFAPILRGRPWRPLNAKLCDAKHLRGLPMLRQMPDELLSPEDWDMNFLGNNCAVVDDYGKILDLYIAMSNNTVSWAELRNLEPFTSGLELSWNHDPILDSVESILIGSDGRDSVASTKSAGDIVPSWVPPARTIKRTASKISRTPSIGSLKESYEGAFEEATRTKMQCPYAGSGVDVVDRWAEAV